MSGAVKKAGAAVGKVSSAVQGSRMTVKELLSGGGWRVVHDGNLMQTLLLKSPKANHIGTDQHGNRYFEDLSQPAGMHRWVLFGNMHKMTGEDPSTVPAEWHGWLHFISDQVPTQEPFSHPIYAVEPRGNPTGNLERRYLPKGSWTAGPQRRHWQKLTGWDPNSPAGKPIP